MSIKARCSLQHPHSFAAFLHHEDIFSVVCRRRSCSSSGYGEATNPSVLESTIGSNIRDNKQGRIQSQALHSQDLLTSGSPVDQDFNRDQNLYLSHHIGAPATTTSATLSSVKGHFNEIPSQHPQEFYNDHRNGQQFANGRQQTPGQIPFYSADQQSSKEQQFFNAEQQFYNDNQQPSMQQQQFFNDQKSPAQQQQFYNDKQQSLVQQQHQQQQFFNDHQQSPGHQQQFFNDKQQSPIQQQQFFNDQHQSIKQQQQIYNDQQQSINQQQQVYNDQQQSIKQQQQVYNDEQQQSAKDQQLRDQRDRYNMPQGVPDQHLNSKTLFQNVAKQQTQIHADQPSVQIHSVSKGGVQLSAFDNRAQPIVLPRSTAVQSTSVVVSGLKNLPVLPAMVYNGGAIPATHAMVYGRDPLYKGGAGVRQHVQTPFVRYVYSHIL
ncbi:uncharacterized protein CDAR_496981 [Caerostris darwini]|uniref:Uncharacterized protein n=1 Tax=Caerostris darwini TaxID=1538125 RepID=A0AAV4S1K3_9ARAC|nr:uncharacterized protein CDAR_496981 [Caerostris darwini]